MVLTIEMQKTLGVFNMGDNWGALKANFVCATLFAVQSARAGLHTNCLLFACSVGSSFHL